MMINYLLFITNNVKNPKTKQEQNNAVCTLM